MSDRRFVAAIVAVLVVLVGVAMIVLPLLELRDPVQVRGEGEQVDLTRVLTAAVALGVLLVIAGASTAIALFRAAMRGRG